MSSSFVASHILPSYCVCGLVVLWQKEGRRAEKVWKEEEETRERNNIKLMD